MPKSGLDYFPLDVNLDDKFALIEAQFGIKGFGVIVKLFQHIYGGQGYYLEWTEDIGLLFARKVGLDYSLVSDIVGASVRRGIFDAELYAKYGVLSSRGIQERYLEAASRRQTVELKSQYLLLCNIQKYKNVDIKAENVNISSENADIYQQSKVKESKVKEKRVCPVGAGRSRSDGLFDKFWAAYPRKVKKQDALKAWDKLKVDDVLLVAILSGLEAWVKCSQWTKDGIQFVPYPATFLRARQWEEQPEEGLSEDDKRNEEIQAWIRGEVDFE